MSIIATGNQRCDIIAIPYTNLCDDDEFLYPLEAVAAPLLTNVCISFTNEARAV